MKIYNYFEYDSDDPDILYDITGEDHRIFLETCFKFCAVVSFQFTDNDALDAQHRNELEPFRIEEPEWVRSLPENSLWTETENIYYFRLCPELLEVLQTISDGLFHWLDGWGYCNPENPTFYREDGSIFFSSEIHDGICTLAPYDNEDVSRVLSIKKWYEQPEGLSFKWMDWRIHYKHYSRKHIDIVYMSPKGNPPFWVKLEEMFTPKGKLEKLVFTGYYFGPFADDSKEFEIIATMECFLMDVELFDPPEYIQSIFISDFVVAEEWRGKGFGSIVMQEVIRYAEQHGAQYIQSRLPWADTEDELRQRLCRFLERHGFTVSAGDMFTYKIDRNPRLR